MAVTLGTQAQLTTQRPLLVLSHVSKHFGGLKALDDVSFEVRQGGLFGVIGPNGAGKTTLTQTICGLVPMSSGKILFNDTDITKLPAYRRAQLGIALCHEGRRLFKDLTVRENIELGARYASLGVLVLTIVCIVLLIRSSFGLQLMAIRDDEEAAAELGVNSFLVKMTAFTVSGFFVGLAGALIALQNVSIEPNSAFSLNWTVSMIIMSVLGGLATIAGPLIGVVVIFTLQQLLQSYGSWSSFLIGLLLIVVIRLAPQGIWVLLRQGFQRFIQMTLVPQSFPSRKEVKDI